MRSTADTGARLCSALRPTQYAVNEYASPPVHRRPHGRRDPSGGRTGDDRATVARPSAGVRRRDARPGRCAAGRGSRHRTRAGLLTSAGAPDASSPSRPSRFGGTSLNERRHKACLTNTDSWEVVACPPGGLPAIMPQSGRAGDHRLGCPTYGRSAAHAARRRSRTRQCNTCRGRSLTSSPAFPSPSLAPRSIGTRGFLGDRRTRAPGKKPSGTSTSTQPSSSSRTLSGRALPDHLRRRRSRRAPGALGCPRHHARTHRDLSEWCPPREGPRPGWERDRVR